MSENRARQTMTTGQILANIESAISPKRPIGWARAKSEAQEPEPQCQICGDVGFFVPDVEPSDPSFGKAVPCSCVGAVVARRLWKKSGLTEAERGWSVDFAKGKDGKDLAIGHTELLLERGHGWLTLWGHYGVGKTGLLKAAVATRIRSGRMAYYRRASDILAEARATYNTAAPESEGEIFERFALADFLAIDEVDRINMTSWAFTWLQGLLDERYTRRDVSATILATNTRISDMGEEWGYLASRMGDGAIVVMAGENLRTGPETSDRS